MNNNKKNNTKTSLSLIIPSLFGASAILLGAFSAHSLEKMINENLITIHQLNTFEKAVKYQMYHAIVLLALVLFNTLHNNTTFKKSILIISTGIILFSGSLYWIALQNLITIPFPYSLFWLTPLGGILLVIGWTLIPYEIIQSQKTNR